MPPVPVSPSFQQIVDNPPSLFLSKTTAFNYNILSPNSENMDGSMINEGDTNLNECPNGVVINSVFIK